MKLASLLLGLIVPLTLVAQETGLPNFPFLHAKGPAEKRIPPNTATLSFLVLVHDKDADKGMTTFRGIESRLVAELLKVGLERKDITARDMIKMIVRKRDESFSFSEVLGYDFSRSFVVQTRNLQNLEAVAEAVMRSTNTGEIHTEFDHTDRLEIEKQLSQDACKNARDNADRIAQGFGMKVIAVYGISDTGIGPMYIRMMNHREDRAYGAPGAADSGGVSHGVPEFISIKDNVDALFMIAEAK